SILLFHSYSSFPFFLSPFFPLLFFPFPLVFPFPSLISIPITNITPTKNKITPQNNKISQKRQNRITHQRTQHKTKEISITQRNTTTYEKLTINDFIKGKSRLYNWRIIKKRFWFFLLSAVGV